ncbi:MAG: transglycosylase domain-containing protein [Bilophila wadsworthia]
MWPPVGWLETEQPRTTSFMEYRQEQWQNGPKAKDGKAMRIRQQWVPLKRIAPALRQAVVTSEDDLFWKHDGFNFSQMYDALKRNWDKAGWPPGATPSRSSLPEPVVCRRSILRRSCAWRLELALDKGGFLTVSERRGGATAFAG